MKKKVISLLLTAAMATTMFAGCGSSSEENTTADNNQTAAPAATETAAEESTEAAAPAVSADGKIAMITDSGDITDESFNQITWETCVAYGDKNGIEYQYYKPAEDTDEERINAIDLAVADGATVIVMPGYLFGPAIAEEQDLYPDVSFIAVDVTEADIVDLSGNAVGISDNVYICSFQEEQAGYLAGYAAVKDGYTSLGFLGGIAVPAVIRYGYGYIQGINDAAEEMGVDVDVKYYYGGQFYGSDAITARMEGWYQDGTQVVFACGGGIYTSAAEAAQKKGMKVIGVDTDQAVTINKLGTEGMTVTSAMKGLAPATKDTLAAIVAGKWDEYKGKITSLGLVSGDDPTLNYVQLPMDSTQFGEGFTKEDYTALVKKMFDGEITVSDDITAFPTVTNTNVSNQGSIIG